MDQVPEDQTLLYMAMELVLVLKCHKCKVWTHVTVIQDFLNQVVHHDFRGPELELEETDHKTVESVEKQHRGYHLSQLVKEEWVMALYHLVLLIDLLQFKEGT